MLDADECSNKKKAQMILNNIEQSIIDKMCSPEQKYTVQQPVQIIINNSSSADNTNINADTNTAQVANGDKDYPKIDSIQRDRMYIAINLMIGSGESNSDSEYGTYTSDSSGSTRSLTLGYVFDSNNRFEIAPSNVTVNKLDHTTFKGIDLNWIWTIGSKEIQSGDIRPYLLFGFGGYSVKRGSETADALGVNLGLGITYPIGDSFEVDLGYHAKSIAWEEKDRNDYFIYNNNITRSIDLYGINLALRFKI